MRTILILALLTSTAFADQLVGNRDEAGRITHIGRGVWEIDLGALGVLTQDHEGDASVMRLSSDLAAGLQYYVRDNLSVGVEALFDYDDTGGGNVARTFGGAIDATLHFRLGLGAFFRPGIAVGVLGGTRDLPGTTDGVVMQASQIGFITHVRLPIAYFASARVLLQAGP
ncbi:MAG TPA: hypothetical protein VGC41_02575, partial [Kofleriaceae bacterium]